MNSQQNRSPIKGWPKYTNSLARFAEHKWREIVYGICVQWQSLFICTHHCCSGHGLRRMKMSNARLFWYACTALDEQFDVSHFDFRRAGGFWCVFFEISRALLLKRKLDFLLLISFSVSLLKLSYRFIIAYLILTENNMIFGLSSGAWFGLISSKKSPVKIKSLREIGIESI